MTTQERDVPAAIASVPFWYHTIELGPGVVTPGFFDLRPIAARLPWPDVRGKRCLDVGSADGYLAFEMERRGASEVVAVDVADSRQWDWPVALKESGPEKVRQLGAEDRRAGFEVARRALGSSVERVDMPVYELRPEDLGTFDVVVCGSLLLHLRDPLRALEAIRGICEGHLLSAEQVRLRYSIGRRSLVALDGLGETVVWWVPSRCGHERMLAASGFEPERRSGLYRVPHGPGYPTERLTLRRTLLKRVARRPLLGGYGVPHSAVLARRL